jgi:hypothetical protein
LPNFPANTRAPREFPRCAGADHGASITKRFTQENKKSAALPVLQERCSVPQYRVWLWAKSFRRKKETTMALLTLKVMASVLQLHGPGATIQSDHQGIDALLGDMRAQGQEQGVVPDKPAVTQAYFRRGGFIRAPYAGAFRRGGYVAPGGFRRAFARSY